MKLLLVFFTVFFCCLMMGTENGEAPEYEGVNTEVVVYQDQIMADIPDISVSPNWLRSYLLMLNILDPVKQIDLSGDHDKIGIICMVKYCVQCGMLVLHSDKK